jgi:hypothetical protein
MLIRLSCHIDGHASKQKLSRRHLSLNGMKESVAKSIFQGNSDDVVEKYVAGVMRCYGVTE